MSTTLTHPDTEAAALGRAEDAAADKRARRGKLVRYAAMPTFLIALNLATFVWLSGQDLDSIERRTLTADNLIGRAQEHVWLTVLSTTFVLLLAIPLGIVATRPAYRRFAPAIIGLGNAGQAIPSFGMLALLFYLFRVTPWLPSTGTVPVVVALVGYSFLPILRNTMVGLDQVDSSVLEAGRGMGMSTRRVLRRIELPLAVPVILAGIRTALVLNVGTATLAFLFGGGGLGDVVYNGLSLRRVPITIVGAVLVASLALLVDYLASLIEEKLTPRGL